MEDIVKEERVCFDLGYCKPRLYILIPMHQFESVVIPVARVLCSIYDDKRAWLFSRDLGHCKHPLDMIVPMHQKIRDDAKWNKIDKAGNGGHAGQLQHHLLEKPPISSPSKATISTSTASGNALTRIANASLWSSKLLFVLVCLLGMCHAGQGSVLRDDSTGGEGCNVVQNANFKSPHTVKLLSFVTPEQSLIFCSIFKGHDKDYFRDLVELSNSQATHDRVRLRSASSTQHHILPILIPEGWNNFEFTVAKTNLTLVWVSEQEEVTLFNLTMESTAEEVLLRGNFALCSGESPEWQVSEGDQVVVPLDPQRKVQHLEVTGDSNATAYLKLPENYPNLTVPANTSLTVNTTRSGSGAIVEIIEEGREATHIEQQSRSRPVMVMGGRSGSTRLRLKREVTPPPPPPPSPQSTSSPFFISTVVLAALLVVACVAHIPPVRHFITTTITRKEEDRTRGLGNSRGTEESPFFAGRA